MRHPLTYLVEAADDICYTIIDFEDGINLGWIPEDFALEYLINLVRKNIKSEVYSQLTSTAERLTYIRSLAINNLITDCVDVFMDNEEAILNGTYTHALTDKSQFKPQIDDILAITIEKVYRNEEVIQKEIAGYKILTDILHAVITATVNDLEDNKSIYDKLILNTCTGLQVNTSSLYERILNACGYVASLTDSRALQLFSVINGSIK
ncbi:dNTP triphosphohydrolase [Nonlabens ulvanivorans]|nr:dNTP triphosphohydrolase [Nonlabens ulvanivorans]